MEFTSPYELFAVYNVFNTVHVEIFKANSFQALIGDLESLWLWIKNKRANNLYIIYLSIDISIDRYIYVLKSLKEVNMVVIILVTDANLKNLLLNYYKTRV